MGNTIAVPKSVDEWETLTLSHLLDDGFVTTWASKTQLPASNLDRMADERISNLPQAKLMSWRKLILTRFHATQHRDLKSLASEEFASSSETRLRAGLRVTAFFEASPNTPLDSKQLTGKIKSLIGGNQSAQVFEEILTCITPETYSAETPDYAQTHFQSLSNSISKKASDSSHLDTLRDLLPRIYAIYSILKSRPILTFSEKSIVGHLLAFMVEYAILTKKLSSMLAVIDLLDDKHLIQDNSIKIRVSALSKLVSELSETNSVLWGRVNENNPTLSSRDLVLKSIVSGGGSLAYGLTNDNKVYKFSPQETKLSNLSGIVQIACGFDFALFLSDSGQVYGHGKGSLSGALKTNQPPELVSELDESKVGGKVTLIGAGHSSGYAYVGSTSTLFSWSKGNQRFGDQSKRAESPMTPFPRFTDELLEFVGGGVDFSLALTSSGKVWIWENISLEERNQNESAEDPNDANREDENKISDPKLVQYFVTSKIKIEKICCGFHHVLAIDSEGKVYSIGLDRWRHEPLSPLGHEDNDNFLEPYHIEQLSTKAIDCAANENSSLVILEDKSAVAFGANCFGTSQSSLLPLPISRTLLRYAGHHCALSSREAYFVTGYSRLNPSSGSFGPGAVLSELDPEATEFNCREMRKALIGHLDRIAVHHFSTLPILPGPVKPEFLHQNFVVEVTSNCLDYLLDRTKALRTQCGFVDIAEDKHFEKSCAPMEISSVETKEAREYEFVAFLRLLRVNVYNLLKSNVTFSGDGPQHDLKTEDPAVFQLPRFNHSFCLSSIREQRSN